MNDHLVALEEQVPLAPFTTLGLGGPARYFLACRSIAELREGLRIARERRLPLLVLGGGSNVVIGDAGFDGLVIRMETRGIARENTEEGVRLTAAAGEFWDRFVRSCVEQGLAGVECLSGIPGSVGATPIQNVGAYGQEVSQTIQSVRVMDILTLEEKEFTNAGCRFGYRQSRFKQEDAGQYVVTAVTFMVQPEGRPVIHYPELRRHLEGAMDLEALQPGQQVLEAVREAVIALRRRKSMVIDPSDPNTKSVGSFFTNPVISAERLAELRAKWPDIPSFHSEGGAKIPAAWLVEHAGFHKGYRLGGAAVSDNHALALVNKGTTSAGLLSLAATIRKGVLDRFGIVLEMEPVMVGAATDVKDTE